MQRIGSWLGERFAERPAWMNALLMFAAIEVFVYSPWDIFCKPVAADQDVWLGLVLTGWMAKLGGLVHWAIYALALYGFVRMRRWMWPWASVYTAQVAFGMLVWPIAYLGGTRGWTLGIASGAAFALVAFGLWRARELFEGHSVALPRRYGKWAVVTGASAGIGLEFARALAARGFCCVLCARREERLHAIAKELVATYGVDVRVVAADLASPDGPDHLADEVADLEVGMLVSNAGFGYAGRFEKQDVARLREMIALNCTANVVLTARLLPPMLERRKGAVVITGSVAGRQPIPYHAVYSATKGFDLLLGEALWVELHDRGIDVLVVQPGPVATEFEEMAGEARTDPASDESAASVVATSLDALGHQPSVVTGWLNWLRANVNRCFPRSTVALIAADVMENQTPRAMR